MENNLKKGKSYISKKGVQSMLKYVPTKSVYALARTAFFTEAIMEANSLPETNLHQRHMQEGHKRASSITKELSCVN
jgi:hypothetical protein